MNMIRGVVDKLGKPDKVFDKQNSESNTGMIIHVVTYENSVFDEVALLKLTQQSDYA